MPASVLEQMNVPQTNIFFLGCFESRVTVLSQQIRALNLIDAILSENRVRPKGRIAIIGGGLAGVTAAAALARTIPGLNAIDLYERNPDLLHVQRGSDRYLHPHIYDWPEEHSLDTRAGLPILDWAADPARKVVQEIERQFEDIRKGTPIQIKTNRCVQKVEPFSNHGCRVRVEGAPNEGGDYDAVIISIGFGYERVMQGENRSYWSPSPLVGPIRSSSKHVLFISGNGDGGLVDFMMAAFKGLRHDEICKLLTEYPGLDETTQILREIEQRAWGTHGSTVDIYSEYQRLVRPGLPPFMFLDVRENLRKAEVWFHTQVTCSPKSARS